MQTRGPRDKGIKGGQGVRIVLFYRSGLSGLQIVLPPFCHLAEIAGAFPVGGCVEITIGFDFYLPVVVFTRKTTIV
jgi:hypothetical protein